MGARLARIFGGETNFAGNSKKKVILSGHDVTVKYVDPDSDSGIWDNVDGNGAVFVDGIANPLDIDTDKYVDTFPEETDCISESRYEFLVRMDFWMDALQTMAKGDLLRMIKIVGGSIAALVLMNFLMLATLLL